MWLPFRLTLSLFLLVSACAHAGQASGLSGYVHQRWLEGNDAPVPVVSIVQGRDGFIWLATGDGLYRFDGIRFERIDAETPLKNDAPSALLATRSGDIWVSFESSHRLGVYRNGTLRLMEGPPAPDRVVSMAEGDDGTIWALTANYNAQVLRLKDGTTRVFDARDGLPESNASQVLVAGDGTLWVSASEGAAWLRPGEERFHVLNAGLPTRLSRDSQGNIWASDRTGTYALPSNPGRGAVAASSPHYPTDELDVRGMPVFDRKGNLWVVTRYQGVRRYQAVNSASQLQAPAEAFTTQEGLSSDIVHVIFEDREGNLWIGTEGGLDRLREAAFVREPSLASPARFGDKLLAGHDGTVYIGQANTVFRVPAQGVPERIIENIIEPEAICESAQGSVWVVLRNEVLVWSERTPLRRLQRPDLEARHNIAYDCAFDAESGFWMSSAGGGVHVLRKGQWQKVFDADGDAATYPTTLTSTPSGGIAFQSGERLMRYEAGRMSTTPLRFGGSPPKVVTLQASEGHLYAAGAFGLTRLDDKGGVTAWAPDITPASRINGLVQTPGGDLWLTYPRMLARVSREELEQAFAKGKLEPPRFSLGRGDGLASRAHSHSQRALVMGGDGRLWIATQTGTLWLDPSSLGKSDVAPGVLIAALRDGTNVHRDPVSIQLPAATTKLEIDYAVLTFSDPQRAQVKYRLKGFDQDWVHPGQRRQAFYTNLTPGRYRFEVMAANSDGVWSPAPASLDFEIPKTFFQTGWFPLLCLAATLLVLFALHRLHLRRTSNQIRTLLEERNAERERIARELHDTLLQGVMGLVLRFQAVANTMPKETPVARKLDSALVAADAVVTEARNSVHDLRGADEGEDLLATLKRIAADTAFSPPVSVRILIEGQPRRLHPLVAEEIAKIVKEGLLNIAHHAQASEVEIAVDYASRHLAVRVRDDGVGIPEDVLEQGRKAGHFGMVGMRERAERIGGTLNIISVRGDGVELTLLLPGKLAYGERHERKVTWWKRMFGRATND